MIVGVDLVHELKSVTAALDQAGVAYALCGALALAIQMKLTAARPKDVEDVARLEELDR